MKNHRSIRHSSSTHDTSDDLYVIVSSNHFTAARMAAKMGLSSDDWNWLEDNSFRKAVVYKRMDENE
jgi:hypothetical protein